jgi:TM2 domain-containing membrane protein YozV
VLALILGFIPGVGAIYNGQYAKGLIHAVVFGLLVSLAGSSRGSLEPLIGLLIAAWVFYMAFEAFHTARKRRYGVAVEEFSSLFDVRPTQGRFPGGAVLLIGLGFILLLDTTDIISMDQLERYWPVGLIAIGIYMLYARLSTSSHHANGGDRKAEVPK